MSTSGKITLGLLGLSITATLLACRHAQLSVEDVGESIAVRLLEILPRKNLDSILEENNGTTMAKTTTGTVTAEGSPPPSKMCIYDNQNNYVAKKAMERRLSALRETCLKYGDFMRPEYFVTLQNQTLSDDILYDPSREMALCPVPTVARGSLQTLFERIKGSDREAHNKFANFKTMYPSSMKNAKRAIMVRHPLERLVSAYRYINYNVCKLCSAICRIISVSITLPEIFLQRYLSRTK